MLKKYKQFINENSQYGKRIHFPIDRMIPDPTIKEDILTIANLYWNENFQIYLVGGAVRDAYLGKEPKDYDLVTNALPEDTLRILRGYKTLPIGEAFGIHKVFTENGNDFEIATFRKDSESADGRHPDSVEFTDLYGDFSRRDLTINALYYDLSAKEEIIDFSTGVEDVKSGTIRTVGDPDERFTEDKLRKLRAIRFAARFDSEIDEDTDNSLKRDPNLVGISFERIREEFTKAIKSAESTVYLMELIQRYDMFQYIFPDLNINRNFVEEKDIIIQISVLLYKNDTQKLKRVLNKITYSTDDNRDITFLSELSRLNVVNATTPYRSRGDANVVTIKKSQDIIKLSHDRILQFGEHIGMDERFLEAFLAFDLTVDGEVVKSEFGFKGADIGREIERQEFENFKKLLY